MADAESVRKDAAHWIELKQHLPQEVQDMERDYQAIHAVDLAAAAAAVQKASRPTGRRRRPIWRSRLASASRAMEARSDELWQSSADARRAAAANDFAKVDFAHPLRRRRRAEDRRRRTAQAERADQDAERAALPILGQDPGRHGSARQGNAREYDQKIRTIRTTVADATGKPGASTSDEKWVDVSKAQYQADARRTWAWRSSTRPPASTTRRASASCSRPGFAYMAPPGQSNQYGHWDHHDGRDFWVFYGQYALMRDLLFNHRLPSARAPRVRRLSQLPAAQPDLLRARHRDPGAEVRHLRHDDAGTLLGQHVREERRLQGFQVRDQGGRLPRFAVLDADGADPNADHSPRKFGTGSSRPSEQRAPRRRRRDRTGRRRRRTGRRRREVRAAVSAGRGEGR